MMKLAHMLLAALAATAVSQAQAAVVIGEDNFDDISSSSILNYNGFEGATVVNGTIDFIATGNGFGIQCAGGTGGCIDLDGSTGDAGEIVTELTSFAPGEYTLSFDLSGNQRGGADSVTITIGSLLNETISDILSTDAFQTYVFNFTVASATTASLVVGASGGDNIGPIFDNFLLVQNDVDVPEPAALGLLGLGVLGVALRRRKGF